MNERFYIKDGWTFTGGGFEGIKATVPGCPHADLMKEGLLPDLFYGDNNESYHNLDREDFTYRVSFKSEACGRRARLVFEGIDTYADVYLNGELLGECHNMFIPHVYDVTDKLKAENELEVRFRSPIKEVEGCPERNGAFTTERINSRRIQCTYYWDWVDRFITVGFWLPVYIEYGSEMKVTDAYVYTEAIDDFGAQINATLNFEGYEPGSLVKIEVFDNKCQQIVTKEYFVRESSLNFRVNVKNPALWFPHGYGEQPLYLLRVTVGENVFEEKFGIRVLRVVENEDDYGSDYYARAKSVQEGQAAIVNERTDKTERPSGFCVIVNGQRVFCRGANYVPCEPYPSEITDEKIEEVVRCAKEMGVNMIRVWGGGIFEKDTLYSACDREGILVTQDFLMACGTYPEKEDWFIDELKLEAAHAAKKLRNHPCLAWWSGDNENATHGYDTAEDHQGRDAALHGIEPVIRALDPARRFFKSSPYGGFEYMSQTAGTTHTTNFIIRMLNYLYTEKNSNYKEYLERFVARFIAEEPTYGLPESSSLLKFMSECDLYDEEEKILKFHSKSNPAVKISLHDYGKGFAKNLFGGFESTEDKLFKYRYLQYEWVRVVFENCRRNIGYCDGLVFWMLNDCWPASMGWSLIDYYNRPKAAYYAFRRAAKPLMSSVWVEDGKYMLYASSDKAAYNGVSFTARLLDVNTRRELDVYCGKIDVAPYSAASVTLPFEVSDSVFVVADVEADGIFDRCFYKSGALPLSATDTVKIKSTTEDSITLVASEYTHAVSLEGDCVFSDNYFSLLAGEEKTVYFDKGAKVSFIAYKVK